MSGPAVERAGRWLAARHTRRSFLGRMARTFMLVASGPTLATLLVRRAEARVCGQSGVAPNCPTFDCTDPGTVWGWCWYASAGCCADGGLKKICDCCKVNHPFVHGYCPSGTNVYCIVESCYADPRVQTVPLALVEGTTATAISVAASRHRYPGGRGVAVVGDAGDALAGAVAASMATATGSPLLLSAPTHLSEEVARELRRLGATSAVVVGHGLSPDVDHYLRLLGLTVERIAEGERDLGAVSLAAARWVRDRVGGARAWCLGTDPLAVQVAGVVGSRGQPVVVGVDAAVALGADSTRMVGPEAAGRAAGVPGGVPVVAGTAPDLARVVGTMAIAEDGARPVSLLAVPAGEPGAAMGLAGLGGVMVLHDPGAFDAANAEWVRQMQPALARGYRAGAAGLPPGGIHLLQSALNHFDTHRLIGVPGQGLPVISQPAAERELGRARLQGTPPPDSGARYWVGRANPDRHP